MKLGILFKKSYPKFKGYAGSILGDQHRAKDIVMDVFETLIKKSTDLRTDVNIEAYAMKAIKNRCLNKLRDEKASLANSELGLDLAVDQSSRASSDSEVTDLMKALQRLGVECNSVLTLFGLGYSYAEIAEVEDCPLGTVMSRMARCRNGLLSEYVD